MACPEPRSESVLELEFELFELEVELELLLLLFLERLQAKTTKTKRPAASQAGWCLISSFSGDQSPKDKAVKPPLPGWLQANERYHVRHWNQAGLHMLVPGAASTPERCEHDCRCRQYYHASHWDSRLRLRLRFR